MDILSLALLLLTVVLSVVRNVFSKDISGFPFNTKEFYRLQLVLFFTGAALLSVFSIKSLREISVITVLYGIIYGLLLLAAQWSYIVALGGGKVSICSTVYSLGFILPTVSGALFWGESLTALKIIGSLTVIPAIVISGKKGKPEKSAGNSGGYFLPLILAMLASGGLGIMQKIQQKSAYPEERAVFVITGFLTAGFISLICLLLCRRRAASGKKPALMKSAAVGAAFGCCNLLNTTLSGRLDSALFFPLLNISVILLSLLAGLLIFKEKIGKRELSVFALGVLAIVFLNI